MDIYEIIKLYYKERGIKHPEYYRPANVEHTIKTFYERYRTSTEEQREILKEFIDLEWRIAYYWKLTSK